MQTFAFNQNQNNNQNNARLLVGLASAAVLIASTQKSKDESFSKRFLSKMVHPVFTLTSLNECVGFNDKHLIACMDKVDKGIEKLQESAPGYKRPEIKSGLRGTRYFIEFPIVGQKVDVFSIILLTEKLIRQAGQTQNARVINTDSHIQDDNVSYLIDYEVNSSTASGGKSKGSIYIRGLKGQNGVDSYKFVLEKGVDFAPLDSDMILQALQEVNRQIPPQAVQSKQPRFSSKKDTSNPTGKEMTSQSGDDTNAESKDPVSVLENHGCSVFMPDQRQNKLDWDYLAGYELVKRSIEDTILLALTNGDVYDKITALTRMKNETNRPKCVLFEGPPGCGKTTSAKIISHQVQIPLVYMPLEAIMSKFYGESESRLAEIFEASQAMGSVILFIDEIDSLATSREAGLHEATRRILSTLLRKIDSFESDGEVLVICATNRKKDLDPALISRTDITIRFDLPNAQTRAEIFKRYAKQLNQADLDHLGEMTVNLSGRDISDICKDAERRWASKYIRKEVTSLSPDLEVYAAATQTRLVQMQDMNLRMDYEQSPYQGGTQQQQPLAFGSK